MQKKEKRQIKKKLRIPLFWKFMIGIFVVVLIFGSINILLIHRIIYRSLEAELQQRSLYISRTISEQSIDHLLYDDVVGLNRLVDDMKSVDASVEYVFILDRNREVVAHSFENYFPYTLLDIDHNLEAEDEISVIYIKSMDSDELIRDILVPLLGGSAGYARIGLSEEHITRTINRASATLLGMVLVFFITGVAGALVFSYMLTYPVKSISQISGNLDFSTIRNKKVESAQRYPGAVEQVMSYLPVDELDMLVENFNMMVSRLQKAYDELELAQKKLVQSEKMASVGALAAGVAHEVNNPLAGLMHCIERIKKNPGNREEIIKYTALMRDAARRIETVVRGLLSFTRLPEKSLQQVRLDELLKSALILSSHKLGKNSITISQSHQDPSVKVNVNKNSIEQVFLNLLLNSIDAIIEKCAGEAVKGKINITSRRNGDFLLVSISDNGTGIPADKLGKVLDPFFTTKPPGEGTGLGLPVAIGIVKDHGGELEISSKSGRGTVVNISIPVS